METEKSEIKLQFQQQNRNQFQEIYAQNQELVLQLVDQGYCNMKQVLKQIQKYRGEKEQIIESLKKKQQKNEQKLQKEEKWYSQENLALVQKGHENVVRNFKVLKKVKGDIAKAEQILQNQKNGKKEKKIDQNFSEQKEALKFLIKNGVNRPVMMNYILRRFQNDTKQALKFFEDLKQSQFFKQQKQEKIKDLDAKKAKKQEREKQREQKREKKGEKKEKSLEKLNKNFKGLSIQEWKEKSDYLYVDGNNLFYVLPAIRNLIIENRAKGQEQATKILTDLVKAFGLKKNLKETILIFDAARNVSKSERFQVLSARPSFQTSDDNFVFLSESFSQDQKENSVFITSDKGLIKRLKENGVEMCLKSGKFFDQIKEDLGQDFEDIIQNGINQYQKKQQQIQK